MCYRSKTVERRFTTQVADDPSDKERRKALMTKKRDDFGEGIAEPWSIARETEARKESHICLSSREDELCG